MTPGAVTIGFCHPGHYAACFAESLKEALLYDLSDKQRTCHAHGQIGKECGSGGIVDGRNLIARVTLEDSEAEWLWFVDSDMGFECDTLERLIAAADPVTRPVVGALCFGAKHDGKSSFHGSRYRAYPTVLDFYELEDRIGFSSRIPYPADEVVECGATGAACLLIHRNVLEKIHARHGENWFTPITHPRGPTTFSEDLSFCVRVAEADFPIHVHTGIKTTHDKGFAFLDEEFWIAQEVAAGRQILPEEATTHGAAA